MCSLHWKVSTVCKAFRCSVQLTCVLIAWQRLVAWLVDAMMTPSTPGNTLLPPIACLWHDAQLPTGAPQVPRLDADHLAALKGLTSLTYGDDIVTVGVICAIAKLTRLRALRLRPNPAFRDWDLQRLSGLTSLTSLEVATCSIGR